MIGPGGRSDQLSESPSDGELSLAKTPSPPEQTPAPQSEETTPPPSSWRNRLLQHGIEAIRTSPAGWIAIVLVLLVAYFAIANPNEFASVANIRNIVTNSATLVVLGVGMTFVLASGGIDLSIGSVVVFSGVVSAKTMSSLGDGIGSMLVGFLVSVIAGAAWGAVNGLACAKLRVPPLIVTLGTLGMALGAAQIITNGIDLAAPTRLSTGLGIGRIAGIPWLDIIALAVAVILAVVLRVTVFGRHCLAIGSNTASARRAAVPVNRRIIEVYVLMGSLSGVAGFLSLARFGTTTISGHGTDNLNAIAATVLGGTSLFGGVATILGTVIGVFIPTVLQNGFVIVGVQPFWQEVVVGAVLVAAVYFDQLRRESASRGRSSRRPALLTKLLSSRS